MTQKGLILTVFQASEIYNNFKYEIINEKKKKWAIVLTHFPRKESFLKF